MAFFPQPGEVETNDDLYESSDDEYNNRLRLGSLMIPKKEICSSRIFFGRDRKFMS